MNTLHKILLGVFGGGGFTATTSWYVYDNVINPTLAKSFGSKWNPIKLTINTPPPSPNNHRDPTPSYSGSGCFQRFFGNIKIEKFSVLSGTSSDESKKSSKFNTLFKDSKSDIYGCAVGQGSGPDFYEIVLKNEEIGFATWYDKSQKNQQRTFVLKKENSNWQIELGIWTTKQKDVDQIKDKTGNWTWFFMMSKDKATVKKSDENIQPWEDVFKGKHHAFYDISKNEWNGSALSGSHIGGKIPDFSKVETLDDFCEKEGNMRKPKPTGDEEKKLKTFCIV